MSSFKVSNKFSVGDIVIAQGDWENSIPFKGTIIRIDNDGAFIVDMLDKTGDTFYYYTEIRLATPLDELL